ncbi:MAG: hypothetical protein KG003_07815 [Bacteroidetes bacterium]|nr:hypothetical protein [Bacteroidota bacterium]
MKLYHLIVLRNIIIISLYIFSTKIYAQDTIFIKNVTFDDCSSKSAIDSGWSSIPGYGGNIIQLFSNKEIRGIFLHKNKPLSFWILVDTFNKACLYRTSNYYFKNEEIQLLRDFIKRSNGWYCGKKGGQNCASVFEIEIQADGPRIFAKLRLITNKKYNAYSVSSVNIINPRSIRVDNKILQNIKVYNAANSEIPCDFGNSICVDEMDVVWYGTCNGIVQIINDKFDVILSEINSKKNIDIFRCEADGNNIKWFRVDTSIYSYDGNRWRCYDSLEILKGIRDIYCDRFSRVWFFGTKYIVCLENNKWIKFKSSDFGISRTDVCGMFVDGKKRMWIGDFEKTVMIDNGKIIKLNNINDALKGFSICEGVEDTSGNIWFRLYQNGVYPQKKGLVKYTLTEQWEFFDVYNSGIPRSDLTSIAIDKSTNNIWMGIQYAGLTCFDGKDWTTYTQENSNIQNYLINDIAIDSKGNIWCSSMDGLYKVETRGR